MRTNAYAVFALAGMLSLAVLAPSSSHAAGDEATAPEIKRQASALFARAEALYRIGDYAHAAPLFEEAHRLAPHPDILWNAARSYDRAGDYARAANAYADYLAASDEASPDRKDAIKALDRLARKLGRIEIHAPKDASISVDGAPVSSSKPYVSPGSHALRVVVNGQEELQTVVVEVGTTRSLSVLPPPPPAPPQAGPPAPAPVTNPAPVEATPPPRSSGGLSPVVFVASAALAAGATGFAIGFGLDTLKERDSFDASPSRESFDAGRDKQARTNVAIGVAAGLWALTAVTGIWLVDWKGRTAGAASATSKPLTFAVSPGFVGAFGAFK